MSARLLLLLGVAAATGCSSRVGTLALTVTRSWEEVQEPLDGIASYVRVRVDGPDLLVGPTTFPFADLQGLVPEVPVGPDRRITIEGLGPERNVTSRGRSNPVEIGAGDNQLAIFVGLIGKGGESSFAAGRALHQARAFHTATLLADGSVVLVGGAGGAWRPESNLTPPAMLRSSERIDGDSLLFRDAADCSHGGSRCMSAARIGHSATLLPSGNVVVAGGNNGTAPVDVVEIFDPGPGTFYRGPQMTPRSYHQAAATERGVALLGGVDASGGAVASAEAYDQGQLHGFPALTARRAFTLTALTDGTLVAIGGFGVDDAPVARTEILAPGSPAWTPGPTLAVPRAYHTATVLADGTILVTGGLDAARKATAQLERFDPPTRSLSKLESSLGLPRWAHTATLLADGRVLIAGGFGGDVNGAPVSSLEALEVRGSDITARPLGSLRAARAGHTATLLATELVLIAGGFSGTDVLDTAEVFVY